MNSYYEDFFSDDGRRRYDSHLSHANNRERIYFKKREEMSDAFGSCDYDRAKREYKKSERGYQDAKYSRDTVASMDAERLITRRILSSARQPAEISNGIIRQAYGEKGQRYYDSEEGRRQTAKHRSDRDKYRYEIEEFPDGKEVVLSYGSSRILRPREPKKR